MKHARREISVALAILALAAVLAVAAPGYFSSANLRDLFLANLPVLLIAVGATLVILTGEIDVSVGSLFAVCSLVAGVSATRGLTTMMAGLAGCVAGAGLGAVNGALIAPEVAGKVKPGGGDTAPEFTVRFTNAEAIMTPRSETAWALSM